MLCESQKDRGLCVTCKQRHVVTFRCLRFQKFFFYGVLITEAQRGNTAVYRRVELHVRFVSTRCL